MSDYAYLPVSDGNGDAPLMHLTANRAIGGNVLVPDTVVGVPPSFIGTTGILLPTGFIDITTKTDFKGHVSGATLIIDAFEPGSSDVGNIAGQVVVIKPNTGWANRVANFIKNLTGSGTPEDITTAKVTASGPITANGGIVLPANESISGAGTLPTTMLDNLYKFKAFLSADLTVADSANPQIIFDAVDFDTSSNYDHTTGIFTVPKTGFYRASVKALLEGGLGPAGVWGFSITLFNGANAIDYDQLYSYDHTTLTTYMAKIADLYHFTAGDQIYVKAFIDTANSSNGKVAGGELYTSFSIALESVL